METKINAIAVGRLVPIKNFDVVLDAWKDVPIPLQIVGEGPEKEKLYTHARNLDLLDRVEFLGERSDVQELMAASDLLISVSTTEGFSYVVLEALRSELVVIATKTGVAAELVPDDYLIEQPQSDLLADAVATLLESWDRARVQFEAAWTTARGLTIQRMVQSTESVYLETLR